MTRSQFKWWTKNCFPMISVLNKRNCEPLTSDTIILRPKILIFKLVLTRKLINGMILNPKNLLWILTQLSLTWVFQRRYCLDLKSRYPIRNLSTRAQSMAGLRCLGKLVVSKANSLSGRHFYWLDWLSMAFTLKPFPSYSSPKLEPSHFLRRRKTGNTEKSKWRKRT